MKTRSQIILALTIVVLSAGAVVVYSRPEEPGPGTCRRRHGGARPLGHVGRERRAPDGLSERRRSPEDRGDLCHGDQGDPPPNGQDRRLRHLRRDAADHRQPEDRGLGGAAFRGLHRSAGTGRPAPSGGLFAGSGHGPGGASSGPGLLRKASEAGGERTRENAEDLLAAARRRLAYWDISGGGDPSPGGAGDGLQDPGSPGPRRRASWWKRTWWREPGSCRAWSSSRWRT